MEKLVVAVGDLHGCIEEFEELLKTLQYNKNQMRLVLLGDLLDRGPDSKGCVRLARQLAIESIVGNHEDKHLRWKKHEQRRLENGKNNPMRNLSIEKQKVHQSLSEDDFHWLNQLPLKLELFPGTWAVHGGCEPRHSLEKQSPSQIIRVRYVDVNGVAQSLAENFSQPPNSIYWSEVWGGPESIIYGHCVHSFDHPKVDNYQTYMCVGIDTGCVFGGSLTAAILKPTQQNMFNIELVQVRAKQKYYNGISFN